GARSNSPARDVLVERPAATALAASFWKVATSGSTVKLRSAQEDERTAGVSGAPSEVSWRLVADCASPGLASLESMGWTSSVSNRLIVAGGEWRKSVRPSTSVVTTFPPGHRLASFTRMCPPAATSRATYGSGTHAPSMAPDWNVVTVWLLA